MRPRSFDEVVGQAHLIGPGKALTALADSGELPSLILSGPAGSGKTTLAHLLAATVGGEMASLSAVSSGVAEARKVMDRARDSMIPVVLFVDEVHRWSKAQQDVLLPAVEDGTIRLIGATTENPFFSLVSPLLSRCLLLRLEPLSTKDLRLLLERAMADTERGLGDAGVVIDEEALGFIAESAAGDARQALSALERSVQAARSTGQARVNRALAEDALQRRKIVYDNDEHYDVISAFIKSMRGSDADAALFWLARMLEAGEDARFIARRMVIFASEDVGLADPGALTIAVAAAHAVELVGLPEAQLNLAHAAIHLAQAPKSNRVIAALGRAMKDQASGDPVPKHLRDAHYPGARTLGHGAGYVYPPDDPEGAAEQQYRPERFEGRSYGTEKESQS